MFQEHEGVDRPFGADEFLPIFIYILVKSQLQHIFALNEELQGLCDPDNRMSETGRLMMMMMIDDGYYDD